MSGPYEPPAALVALQGERDTVTDLFLKGRVTMATWKRSMYHLNRRIDAMLGRAPAIARLN